jgi:PAS domain S-box-containing protein
MNYENFNKSELIKEISTINEQLSVYRLSCNSCENSSINSDMRILGEIMSNLPVVTFTLDRLGNFISKQGEFVNYFPISEPSILNFKLIFINYSDKIAEVIDKKNADFDVEVEIGDSTYIWRHHLHYDATNDNIIGFAMNITPYQKLKEDLSTTSKALSEQEYIIREAKKLVVFGEWHYDIRTDELFFSDTIYELLDINKLNFGNTLKDFIDLIYIEDRKRVIRIILRSREKAFPFDFECRTAIDGRPSYFIHAKGRVIVGKDGKPKKMIGAVQDITFQKMNEKIISDSESHFRLMTENLTDMISKHSPTGDYLYVSPSCEHVMGFKVHELIGTNAYEYFHTEDLNTVRNSHRGVLETPDASTVRYRIRTKSEGYIWVETSTKTIRDSQTDEVREIICVTRNINERKQFQQQLEKNNALISNMLEAVDEGIIVFTNEELTSHNEKFLRMWDIEDHKIIGLPEDELFKILSEYVLNQDEFYSRINEMVTEVETIYNNVIHLQDKKVFELTTKKKISDGVEYGRIWLFRDISEQTKANDKLLWYTQDLEFAKYDLEMKEQELRKTVKELKVAKQTAEEATLAKSMFLANMSHEIRTPMNAILGFSELILEGNLNQKEKLYTSNILNAGKNLLNLINDILDLSKIEAGKIALSYEYLNLEKFLEEIQSIFSFKTNEKGVDLRIVAPEDMPKSIYLDETRLRQIMFNLVGNAVKFTDSGSIEVKVEVDKLENENSSIDLAISVIDSGIGIPEDQFDSIFESFNQREGQSTRKYGGTGLGLSISKRLTEMMNGFMTLESTEGVGSAFTVNLHKVMFSEEVIESLTSDSIDMYEHIIFSRSKILITDDVKDNRDVAIGFLERFDFDIHEAENGQQAVDFALEYNPDLILMDIKMPVMDGTEATEIIKANEATKNIPVIAFTASVMKENIDEIEAICDGVLFKPLDRSLLFEQLMRYIDYEIIKPEEEIELEAEEIQSEVMTTADISELKVKFEEWEAKHKTLVESFIIDEIEEFAAEIIEFSEPKQIKKLISFGEDLLNACSSFDVENMEKDMRNYPQVINSIIENIVEE